MKYSDYEKIKWFNEFVEICSIDLSRVPEYHDNPILEYLEQINDFRWVDECEISSLKKELKIKRKQLKVKQDKLQTQSRVIRKFIKNCNTADCELKVNFAITQLEKLKNKLNDGTQLVDIYVFGVIDKQILDLTFVGDKKNVKQSNK